MKFFILTFIIFFVVNTVENKGPTCGCRNLRTCYRNMIETLHDHDEENCVENVAMGSSTLIIFLKALKQFCGEVVNVTNEHVSYEGRRLFEVILNSKREGNNMDDEKPIIVLEAGQLGGTESMTFALYVIEQLVACSENSEMLEKVRWVVLPCTNPDGQEYARFNRKLWRKNLRPSEDNLSFGVDISRNFDTQWNACDKVHSRFSPAFPGMSPASENETIFIKDVLGRYKRRLEAYVSIRRDGHSIMYPYAYTKNSPDNGARAIKVAGNIAAKVNQRAGGVHLFLNDSIYNINGKPHCGHSVDYAFDIGIPLAYEMRVFLGFDILIMSKFQTLPRGYEASLRGGYFSGIRELYHTIVLNDKRYNNRGF